VSACVSGQTFNTPVSTNHLRRRPVGNKHQTTPLDRARDELFSHVIRCNVLEATMQDREEWLVETMDYMAGRHPHLTGIELAQLEVLGGRFIKPSIPHGAEANATNRDKWQEEEEELQAAA
jgi:hypothetical protein